jgi:serine/threonine protein phosphatase 1
LWLQNGGAATQCNYSGTNGRIEDSHLAWLRTLPFCHDDGLRFFVHAGIDLAKPLDEQSNEGMLWMREPFLSFCDEVDCGRARAVAATAGQIGIASCRAADVCSSTPIR